MCPKESRNRMRTLIFLCILGLIICQAAGRDNSTQVYHAKLKADKSLIQRIRELLGTSITNDAFIVDSLKMTTRCETNSTGTTCTCESGYKWNDTVCKSNEDCCGKSECTFNKNSIQECVSERIVTITGSLTLTKAQNYTACLNEKPRDEYLKCHDGLLNEMKEEYSTLSGFDTLTIEGFRVGSVIVDFQLVIVSGINAQNLIDKAKDLTDKLNAELSMQTTGVVTLNVSSNPVLYDSAPNLICTAQEDLGSEPKLSLNKTNRVFNITNGRESQITLGRMWSEIKLNNVSGLWAGQYICEYNQKQGSISVFHKATAVMDVALLPNIETFTKPSFPRCDIADIVQVQVNCEVQNSSENYTVTWTDSTSRQSQVNNTDTITYSSVVTVDCSDSSKSLESVSCTFTNRLNQNKSASVKLSIIQVGDKFCKADGDWEDTKAGYTAKLKCQDSAGIKQRKCGENGIWEQEQSACVNSELNSVLQSAIISDIGLGELDKNAADVFYRLRDVTGRKNIINSFANVNASISVLKTLSVKPITLTNVTATENFLDSSSNLLNSSVVDSWTTSNSESNSTLAETYLHSVEQLIMISNITEDTKKQRMNLEVASCDTGEESGCNNTVFSVNVSLTGASNVKTAGFKELELLLPNDDNETEPNSIVVSATANKTTDTMMITIDFELFRPRPRNVQISCVSWDNNTRRWSGEGCTWLGSSHAQRCVCTHLSAFSVLMSKEPLDIPFLTEITYVGVSISVISLVISLIIELIVWSDVVKTNTLYLRHTAHVNISLCLLVADCSFLAAADPKKTPPHWCKAFVLLKHFCYLAMFFWMLCLSCTLLHQAVFLFHKVSKKNYLRFSLILGYACPLLIVFITFLTNEAGAVDKYYSKDTCWLVYSGFMRGSIFTFVIPAGIIVFVNIFSMAVVIMKLLEHHKNTEKSFEKDKTAAKTVIRSIILLTPIFGVTWIFGFALMLFDLTDGPQAYAVNYIFTVLNAFQGLFILLTTCVLDKMTRDALLKRFRKKAPAPTSESASKMDSTLKK